MFGSRYSKIIITLSLVAFLSCPVFSEEFDYSQSQRRISVQEEFGDYMINVQNKIAKTWTPPDVIESGHATVVFKVDKSGNVISSYIKESSGNLLYDESALNSIQKASPYAEFPENSTRDNITVVYSFDSSIISANQVEALVKKADAYINKDNQMALNILDEAIKSVGGDPASYFLYARRQKINKLMGNTDAAEADLAECKRLKALYDKKRIAKCKEALEKDETPFAYFTLANAFEHAGDFQNALNSIDKAISMTELNNAYIRYRAEMIMRNAK